MKSEVIIPNAANVLFIKNIFVFEERNKNANTVLPFFSDGYPGLVFHITPNGQWVQPHNKKMPTTYIYGQSLYPIELHISGSYKIVAIQFYPFVLNSFFNIDAKTLNNGCYDLAQVQGWEKIEQRLLSSKNTTKQVKILEEYFSFIFQNKKSELDFVVADALQIILNSRALLTVKELSSKLHVTIRTLQRRFMLAVGVSVKDFIQITKFQQSLEQLTMKDYTKLTDIVYANGFADQSHFIRVFKAFTGKTPKNFFTKQA